MNSKKLHFILLGIIALLFAGLIGGAYGINSLLVKQSDDLQQLKATSLALEQQKTGLIKAKADIQKYADLEKITKAIVPEDKNQAEAVREIVKIAEQNNVKLASISFPASSLGSGASKPGVNKITTPNSGSKNTKSLSQLVALKNVPGVYQLVIQVESETNSPVTYSSFIGFLDDLEHNRRTSQVSSVSIEPQATNRNLLSFNLTLNGYVKP